MSLFEICQWIQHTETSTGIRESLYVFPLIEGTHVLALTISVGSVMWFDLRLLGLAMRSERVSDVFGYFRPWMTGGFAVMFGSGFLLFWSRAEACYASGYFRIKLLLLLLALLNIVVYHLTVDRRIANWDASLIPPIGARLAGLISLVLWLGIIAAGRIMAYTL